MFVLFSIAVESTNKQGGLATRGESLRLRVYVETATHDKLTLTHFHSSSYTTTSYTQNRFIRSFCELNGQIHQKLSEQPLHECTKTL